MACGRSFYPWDIVITYAGGTIFLDAREPQDFDLLSVNENSHVIPSEEDPEDINGRRRLALEATLINQDFSQQVRALLCNLLHTTSAIVYNTAEFTACLIAILCSGQT